MNRADRISSRIITIAITLAWSIVAPVILRSPHVAVAVTVFVLAASAFAASVADARQEARGV